MKKIILKVSTVLVLGTSVSSPFPVIDAAQVAESILTLARWYKQVSEWKREVEQWEADIKALTEFRLDGNILDKFTELNDLLNEYGLDMGDLDLDNPKSELGAYAKSLFDSYLIFDDCNYDYFSSNQKRICKNKMVRNVQEVAAAHKLAKGMSGLLEKLNDLNTQLKNSEDIKSSQDITAGIQSVVSSMEAIKIQYEIMSMRNEAKQKIEQRQSEQIEKKKRNNSSSFIEQDFL